MDMLSLLLDNCHNNRFFFKGFFLFCFVLYGENVNSVDIVTYKDNRTLGCEVCWPWMVQENCLKRWLMKCPLQICGCLGTDCTFVVTMVTGVCLQLGVRSGDRDVSWREQPCALYLSPSQAPSEQWRMLTVQYTHHVCEYKCKNAEAHSVFLILYMGKNPDFLS